MITRMPATTKGRSPSRRTAAQTLVALIGALALTFGTGAMAATAATPDDAGAGLVSPVETGGDSSGGGAGGADGSAGGSADQSGGALVPEAGDGAGGEGASGEPGATGGTDGSDESGAAGGDEGDGSGEQFDASAARTGADADLQFSAQGKDGKNEKYDRDGKNGKNGKDGKNDRGDKHGGPVKMCRTNGHGGGWSPTSFDKNRAAGPSGWGDRQGSDIIPPFSYTQGDETLSFAGQNWDEEGQEVWKNDCKKPKPPSIEVQVEQCTVPGGEPPATVTVTLGHLKKGNTYTVSVESMGSQVSSQKITAHGSTAYVEMPVSGPGDYTASVKQKGSKGSASSTEFQVAPCPPPVSELTISGEAGQCVAQGGTGTALVTIGGLTSDGVYVVTLWFGEEMVGTQTVEYPEGASAVLTFAISAFGEYTAQVTTQQWMPEYRVEVPQPEQTASVVFTAGEGCPVPVTPAVLKATPPSLAVTGSGSPDLALLSGGLLLALGAAMVLGRGIVRMRSSR